MPWKEQRPPARLLPALFPAVVSKVTQLHCIRAGIEQWLSRPWEGEEKLQDLTQRTKSSPHSWWGHMNEATTENVIICLLAIEEAAEIPCAILFRSDQPKI